MSDGKYLLVRKILIVILTLNWAVAIAKILYGHFTSSLAMLADGFHSLSDGSSNIIGLIGISVAARPKDAGHPYGHRKYETLASMVIAVVLFLIAFNLMKESVHRFVHREFMNPIANAGSFAVMLVTLAINIGVMKYELRKGKELKSDFLAADAMHTGSDIFASISVIITLVCIRLGLPIVDVVAGFIIALLICYIGADILKHSSRVLTDYAVIDVQNICDALSDMNGIAGCHRIRTRGRSDDIHVDLHVTVNKEMSVGKAHELSTSIEKRIRERFPGVTDVIVHIEPA